MYKHTPTSIPLPFLILLLCSLYSCKKEVPSISPTLQPITQSVYASGVVKSSEQYQVFANSSGIVGKVWVAEGAAVKKGQPIVTLINPTASLSQNNSQLAADFNALQNNQDRLDELRQSIDAARAKLSNDSLLAARQAALWKQEIGSRVELEQRELAYTQSKANVKSLQLRYQQLQKQINFAATQARNNLAVVQAQTNDLKVLSEIDGNVFTVLKKKGEMVSPQTPIAVIGNTTNYVLELQVDEFDIINIKTGQSIWVSMDSHKNKTYAAKVTKLYPMMNERSKTFTIEAVFDTLPSPIYPNLTAEANIVIQTKPQALLIPRSYLTTNDSVVLASGERRKVVTGLKDFQQVEILSGLTATDKIIKP